MQKKIQENVVRHKYFYSDMNSFSTKYGIGMQLLLNEGSEFFLKETD